MVSAPDTNCTSVHASPASASASRAAATPYSTKLRPHLPHGCMPTPRTATSCSLIGAPSKGWCDQSVHIDERRSSLRSASGRRGARSYRLPLPDDVRGLVVLVEGLEHELDLMSDPEVVDRRAARELAQHHHLLLGQLDRGDGVGLERVGRHVGSGWLIAIVGERPHLPAPAERYLLEVGAVANRVATKARLAREEVRAARRAAGAEERGRRG